MKARRFAVPTLLLLLAVALSLYAWFVDRGSVSDVEKNARSLHLFPVWRRAEISRIELRQNGTTLVLVRDAGADAGELDFRVTSPVNADIDAAALDQLLSVLEHSNPVRRLEGEPSDFGPERLVGEVTMGKVTTRFVLGGPAPTPEGAAYFRIDGKPVVVARDFVTDITRSADVYREKTLVPYLSVALDALTIQNGARALSLKRIDDLSFRIEGPNLRASRSTIDRLWLALADLRAESFLTVDEATALTRDPSFVVRMTPIAPSQTPAELLIGGPCPGHPERVVFFRKTPLPVGACVPRVALENLGIEGETLADTGLFGMRPDELEDFASAAPGKRLDLARKGTGYRLRAPEDRDLAPAEAETFSRFLLELFKVHGTRVSPAPTLGAPLFFLDLHRGEGKRTEHVDVYAEGAQVYAKRAADGAVLAVPPTLVSLAFPGPEPYRPSAVWDLGAGPTGITLDCGTPQELTLAHGTWTGTGKTTFVVDNARVLELLDTLRRLRADLWFHGAIPLSAENRCSVTLGFVGRPAARLTVGPALLPGYVAAQVDGGTFFAAPEDVGRALRRIYLDRVLIPDDAGIVAATRRKDGKRAELFEDAGAETAQAWVALRTFRADDVVHLGPARPGEGFDKPVEWTIDLARDGGPRQVKLTIGARKDNMYYARYGHADATFQVDASRLVVLLGEAADAGAPGQGPDGASSGDAAPGPGR